MSHDADNLSLETRVEISERIMREIGVGRPFPSELGIGGTMNERGIRNFTQRAIDRALGLTDEITRCDKCGAEITTGMMALHCQNKRECALWTDEIAELFPDVSESPTQSRANP